MDRRTFLSVWLSLPAGLAGADPYPAVRRGRSLRFPHDHGAHPDFRTEWWYVTGWVHDTEGREKGFQVTFFRNRPGLQDANPSNFAPRQLLFAHAALADPRHGTLLHDQRAARAGFGLANSSEGDTAVLIDGWSLRRQGDVYVARIDSQRFELELQFVAEQPILLQGDQGWSQKGPGPAQASYYYSRPQLAVSGIVRVGAETVTVSGTAWLDHEWASEIMADAAVGWDWVGINLADGSALMAFRMRDLQGGTYWAAASVREASGRVRKFGPSAIEFAPVRRWRSPRTGAEYPVSMRVRLGELSVDLMPLMDDQELDARASTGTIYWEGAVRAMRDGQKVGIGYLELTGYWRPLRL